MELRAETSVFDDKLLKEDIDNAQETANNAQAIAGTTAQYFWFLEEIGSVPAGVGTGAHITNVTKEAFLSNPANGGGNLLARSNGIAIRDGLTELAYFSGTAAQIGKSNGYNSYFDAQSFQIRNGSTLLSKFTSNGTDIYLADDSINSVASFGTTVRIGKSSARNVYVTSDGVYIYNGTTQLGYYGSFTRIGNYYSKNVRIDGDGVKINSSQDTVIAQYGSDIKIGAETSGHTTVKSDGLHIWKNVETTPTNEVGKFTSAEMVLTNTSGNYITDTKIFSSSNLAYLTTAARSNYPLGGFIIKNTAGNEGIQTVLALSPSYSNVSSIASSIEMMLSVSASNGIKLVSAGAEKFAVSNTGDVYVDSGYIKNLYGYNNTASSATNMYIGTTGLIHRTTNTSSRRYKHDIQDVTDRELDPHNLYDIEVKQFKYNEDVITDKGDCRYGKDLIGFISEQVYEHFPIAVDINENGECEAWNPQYIIPAMLALLKEQHEEIEKFKAERNN